MMSKEDLDKIVYQLRSFYRLAGKLDREGTGEMIPLIDPKVGVQGSVRNDILLFLASIVSDSAVTNDELQFLNEYIGFAFSDSDAASKAFDDIRKSDTLKTNTLIPAIAMFDKSEGDSYISTSYFKVLGCTVMGYITAADDLSITDMARYYYLFSECIETVEKVLDEKIDFAPLGDDCDKGAPLLIKLMAETYKTGLNGRKDKVIIAIEDGLAKLFPDFENKMTSVDDTENGITGTKSSGYPDDESEEDPEEYEDDEYADDLEEYEDDGYAADTDEYVEDKSADEPEYKEIDLSEGYGDTESADDLEGHEDMVAVSEPDALTELNRLVGLVDVKKQVQSFINAVLVNKRCRECGLKREPVSMHMVFSGNAGTGKTTVARIFGTICKEKGLLSKGHFTEVTRADLVGKYAGYTSKMVRDVFEKAKGGVLFIDEAYSLVSDDSYGQEAISMIIKLMEDYKDDLVVIVAGYPELMQSFLETNPGVRSRFPFIVRFPDYTGDELTEIFRLFCVRNDVNADGNVMRAVLNHFNRMAARKVSNSGNARAVRNYFEQMIMNQAVRLVNDGFLDNDDIFDKDVLLYFLPEDLPDDKATMEIGTRPRAVMNIRQMHN